MKAETSREPHHEITFADVVPPLLFPALWQSGSCKRSRASVPVNHKLPVQPQTLTWKQSTTSCGLGLFRYIKLERGTWWDFSKAPQALYFHLFQRELHAWARLKIPRFMIGYAVKAVILYMCLEDTNRIDFCFSWKGPTRTIESNSPMASGLTKSSSMV